MTKDYNINAVFTAEAYYSLSLAIAGGEGTIGVTAGTYGFTYTAAMMPGVVNLDRGADVTLDATPGAANKFSYWSSDTPRPSALRAGLAYNEITMSNNHALTAHFTGANPWKLDLGISGAGTVDVGIGTETHTILCTDLSYAGYFDDGTSVSLSATPASTQFSYWSISGSTPPISGTGVFDILSAADQTIVTRGDYNMTAMFTNSTPHTLNLAASGNGTVTISLGDGTYVIQVDSSKVLYLNDGVQVGLTATENGSDKFSYWNVHNSNVPSLPDSSLFDISINAKQTIVMKNNHQLTGVFTTNGTYYTLSLAVTGSGTINVSINGGTFDVNSIAASPRKLYFPTGMTDAVGLKASPSSGTAFSYWSGNVPTGFDVLSGDPQDITTGNYDTVANFTTGSYSPLTIGIDGLGEADMSFHIGASNVRIATITSVRTINVTNGTSVTLTAAATGPVNAFSFWSGPIESTSNNITFTMAGTRSQTAVFTDGANDQTLTLAVNNTLWGSISTTLTIGSNTYTISLLGAMSLSENTPVSLKAVPKSPSHFSYWSGTLKNASNQLSIAMGKPYTETAYFTDGSEDVELKVTCNGTGTVDLLIKNTSTTVPLISGEIVMLTKGTVIELIAEATGTPTNHFSYWSGGAISIENPLGHSTPFAMNSNLNIDANFTSGSEDAMLTLGTVGNGTIGLTIGSLNTVSITGGETWFDGGTPIGLEPKPAMTTDPTYFLYWKGTSLPDEDDFDVFSPAGQSFDMKDNYDLTAHFSNDIYTLTVATSVGGKVSFSYMGVTGTVGDGNAAASKMISIPCGTTVTVTAAEVTAGYRFTHWSGLLTAATPSETLTMGAAGGSGTVTGNFEENTYALTIGTAAGGKVSFGYTDKAGPAAGTVGDGSAAKTVTIYVISGTMVDLNANVVDPGMMFVMWEGDVSGTSPSTSFTIRNNTVANAIFDLQPNGPKHYYITTSATSGASISPLGQVAVVFRDNQTFKFSADAGHKIAVMVDGVYLSPGEVASGSYTFYAVKSNHTIVVEALKDEIILEVHVVEGSGHVEYSTNGRAMETCTEAAPLLIHSTLMLTAYPNDGYRLKEWDWEGARYTETEMSFDDVITSIYMEVHFTDEKPEPSLEIGRLLIIASLILLFSMLLLLFLLLYLRAYEVVSADPSLVLIGKEKARRRKAYTFSVKGGKDGTVSYRAGENGEWKPLFPDAEGNYVIPKEDVTGKLFIK
jgi:hypothetical protein